MLPPGFSADLEGVERFARLVLEAALPHVAAVKPNLAFYEANGFAVVRQGRTPEDGPKAWAMVKSP